MSTTPLPSSNLPHVVISMASDGQKRSQQAMDSIFAARPLLKELLAENGGLNLRAFARKNLHTLGMPDDARKKEFLCTFQELLTQRFGTVVAQRTAAQLDQHFFALTTDHHGPLNASVAMTANTLAASGFDASMHSLVVLTCAGVSQNNPEYPRGLLFHSLKENQWQDTRLPLLPSDNRNSVVYGFRPFLHSEVDKILGVLQKQVRTKDVEAQSAKTVEHILQNIFAAPDVLGCKTLCEQFSKINFSLWKEIWHNEPDVPDLLYLEFEELTSTLLLTHHLGKNSLIEKILFNPAYEKTILQPLMQSMLPFLRQKNRGTHLFWGLSQEKHYRLGMQLENNELRSADGSLAIPFAPDAIAQALKNKQLMPTMFVVFTLLHLYYGLNCGGGFNQMHYLDAMRTAYNQSGIDPIASSANSRFYTYGLELLAIEHVGQCLPAYGLDLLLYSEQSLWKDVQHHFDAMTFSEAFSTAVPVIESILNDHPVV